MEALPRTNEAERGRSLRHGRPRPRSKLKVPGLFIGSIFVAMAILNTLYGVISRHQSLFAAITNLEFVITLVLLSLVSFASAFFARLAWLLPLAFLLVAPLPILESSESFFGLGFYAAGISLLYKLGFYDGKRLVKLLASVAYIVILEFISVFRTAGNVYFAITPSLFILVFLLFFYLTFRDRIVVYLKEPKASLSLEEKGLAETERLYVGGIVKGRTVKEVAFDYEVSESTVRNTLARAYKKLGVATRSELAALAEKYEILP